MFGFPFLYPRDDFWPYHFMRTSPVISSRSRVYFYSGKTGSRMQVCFSWKNLNFSVLIPCQTVSMYDLSHSEAVDALCRLRMNVSRSSVEPKLLEDIVQTVGGRLSYLNRVRQSFGYLENIPRL